MKTLLLTFISCASLLIGTYRAAQAQGTIAITKYPALIPAPSIDQDSTSAPPFAIYVTFAGGSANSQYFLKVGTPSFNNATYLMFTYRNSGMLTGTWGRGVSYTDSNFTFQTDVVGQWEGWVPVKAQRSGISQMQLRARLAVGSNVNSAVYALDGMIAAGSGAGYLVGNLIDGTGGGRENKVVVAYSGTTTKGIWLSEVNASSHAPSVVPLDELHSNYTTARGFVNAQGGYAMLVRSGSPSIDRLEIYSYPNNNGSSSPLATYAITFVYQNVIVPDALPLVGQPTTVGMASPITLNPVVQDGDGSATLSNEATGLLNSTTIFPRNSGGQTVKVSVLGTPAGPLDQVRLSIPGGFSGGSVTVGGAFAGKTFTVIGNQITVQNANLSSIPGAITISNLSSSNPVGPLLSGDAKWAVETAAPGGTLVEIVSSPHSQTIIPISNMRMGGDDGFGNNFTGDSTRMHNQTIATTGVVTFENGILQDLNASFVIQSGGKGVEVFRYGAVGAVMNRGDSIIVKGVVTAFGGATEIVPASSGFPDIIHAGTGSLPAPVVLSHASDLSEANECLLVRLNQVVFDSAGQQFVPTTSNRGANNFHTTPTDTGTVWLSGLNTIIGDPIPPSADITGVAVDRLWYTGPRMSRYKIAPRDSADIIGQMNFGPIAYYPFNGNADDESGNGHNGTVFGATLTTDRFGVPNKAYSFDGVNDYIKASASGFPTDNRTISLWFATPSIPVYPVPTLLAYGYGCGTSYWESLSPTGFFVGTHCPGSNGAIVNIGFSLYQWHHWVVISSDTSTEYYLDGSKVFLNHSPINGTIINSTELAIGVAVDPTTGIAPWTNTDLGWMVGGLDDIRIYNRALNPFEIDSLYHEGGYPVLASWNIVSVPLTVADARKATLFPTATSNAYSYTPSGYVVRDTLRNGTGYWLKFPSAQNVWITGTLRMRDTLTVSTGWNMVGTISNPVDTVTIVSIPPGLRGSNWYGYGVTGYVSVTRLTPGQGYWVKANSAGQFVLDSQPFAHPAKAQTSGVSPIDVLNTLTITDSKGRAQTLYFGSDAGKSIQPSMYDMPPLPPVDAFDARFSTAGGGSMVQTHGEESAEFTVAIQSDAYPVTVSWNVKDASYELTAGSGSMQTMRGEGTMKISNSEVNRLFLKLTGNGELPKEFALSQNYPNPFNPSTTIKYDLPKDSRVSLNLFNILGQEVAILVNEDQKAGYKSVEWSAGNFASGVYFYRIKAGDFVASKKLLVLK